jgi:hypothetical protein
MNANDLSGCVNSNLKWFTFHQNNSGGSYTINDDVDVVVIIQAKNADDANDIAQCVAGIYFNGVEDGRDCECCGDRWYKTRDSEATDHPQIYGRIVDWSPDSTSKDGCKIYPYNSI